MIGLLTTVSLGFAAASDGAELPRTDKAILRPRLAMEWEQRGDQWIGVYHMPSPHPEGKIKAWIHELSKQYRIVMDWNSFNRVAKLQAPAHDMTIDERKRDVEEVSWMLLNPDEAWRLYGARTSFLRMLDEYWLSVERGTTSSWTFWTRYRMPGGAWGKDRVGETLKRARSTEISIDLPHIYIKMFVTLWGTMNSEEKALRLTELLLDFEWAGFR